MTDFGEPIISLESVYKIFGPDPRGRAFDLVKDGVPKDEVQRMTGHVVGLDDISFSVNKGEIFVVMGLSGSGKSTAIEILKENIDKLDNSEIINSDTYVEQAKKDAGLPEFEGNYNAEQRKARAKITADAQKYLKEKLEKAINQGKNIILDGTSTSSNAVKQKINQILESENYINLFLIDPQI